MKKTLSPVLTERALDKWDPSLRYQEHQERRERARLMRAFARKNTALPLDQQIKKILHLFMITEAELAEILDIRPDDIKAAMEGRVYPYVRNAWNQIMREPDDLSSRKLRADEKLSNDEKWELMMKRTK